MAHPWHSACHGPSLSGTDRGPAWASRTGYELASPMSTRRSIGRRSCAGVQVCLEESGQRVEGDQVHPVVEFAVAGTGNDLQLLWFGGELVGLFADLAGMGLVAGDEQHGARRDR